MTHGVSLWQAISKGESGMKKALFLLIGIMIFSNVLCSNPQQLQIKYPLTEEDIQEAIKLGLERRTVAGLVLWDELKKKGDTGTTGFSIILLTPYARIVDAAYEAKRKYKNFTREDVTEEMLAPVISISVYPDMPKRLIAKDTELAQSVEHVVLANTTRGMIIQPHRIEFFEVPTQSGLGAEATYKGAYVEFLIEDIIKVSNDDFLKKGEFVIKVIGEQSEKEFRIEEKYIKDLK